MVNQQIHNQCLFAPYPEKEYWSIQALLLAKSQLRPFQTLRCIQLGILLKTGFSFLHIYGGASFIIYYCWGPCFLSVDHTVINKGLQSTNKSFSSTESRFTWQRRQSSLNLSFLRYTVFKLVSLIKEMGNSKHFRGTQEFTLNVFPATFLPCKLHALGWTLHEHPTVHMGTSVHKSILRTLIPVQESSAGFSEKSKLENLGILLKFQLKIGEKFCPILRL